MSSAGCPNVRRPKITTPRRRAGFSALLAATALGLLIASVADGGDRRPPHHPPGNPPAGPPSGPDGPPGDGGHDHPHDEGNPPTSPGGGGGGAGGGGGGGGAVAERLEKLAIVDQFPPGVIVEFEGLLFGWFEFNANGDVRMPFDEWLWANGVEDPEEFSTFMLIFQLIFSGVR